MFFKNNQLLKEKKLLEKIKAGEPVAVANWYRSYYSRVYRVVSGKIINTKDCEEVSQDVFISCLKHLPLFRGESSIWTWMLRIMRHEVADYYRKKYAKKAIRALSLQELFAINLVADSTQTSELVRKALSRIRKDYREILLCKYVDGMRVDQIAQKWQRSFKSIESDLFRARRDFKQEYLLLINNE